jgi:hypothetical protein
LLDKVKDPANAGRETISDKIEKNLRTFCMTNLQYALLIEFLC